MESITKNRIAEYLALDLDHPVEVKDTKPEIKIEGNTINVTYNVKKYEIEFNLFSGNSYGEGSNSSSPLAILIMAGTVIWLLLMGLPYAQGMQEFINNFVLPANQYLR